MCGCEHISRLRPVNVQGGSSCEFIHMFSEENKAFLMVGQFVLKAFPHLAQRQQVLGVLLLELLQPHGQQHVGQSVQQEAMFLLSVSAGGGHESAK